jgi:hypothetical protein
MNGAEPTIATPAVPRQLCGSARAACCLESRQRCRLLLLDAYDILPPLAGTAAPRPWPCRDDWAPGCAGLPSSLCQQSTPARPDVPCCSVACKFRGLLCDVASSSLAAGGWPQQSVMRVPWLQVRGAHQCSKLASLIVSVPYTSFQDLRVLPIKSVAVSSDARRHQPRRTVTCRS